jgi:hypothetical protein
MYSTVSLSGKTAHRFFVPTLAVHDTASPSIQMLRQVPFLFEGIELRSERLKI